MASKLLGCGLESISGEVDGDTIVAGFDKSEGECKEEDEGEVEGNRSLKTRLTLLCSTRCCEKQNVS